MAPLPARRWRFDYPFEIRPLSPDDGGGYLISYPDFGACTSDGETVEQALRNGQKALRVTTTDADAATGERVVLRSGSLVQALRVSIALPFMFKPVHIGGRRLIDGFVADPLPVSAAVDAQAVLALGFESSMPQRVDGPSRLLAQTSSALTNKRRAA